MSGKSEGGPAPAADGPAPSEGEEETEEDHDEDEDEGEEEEDWDGDEAGDDGLDGILVEARVSSEPNGTEVPALPIPSRTDPVSIIDSDDECPGPKPNSDEIPSNPQPRPIATPQNKPLLTSSSLSYESFGTCPSLCERMNDLSLAGSHEDWHATRVY